MDAAVRYWSRATLRRNLRGAVLLMLLIAIGAGGAMAATAGARRSQSSLRRLLATSNMPEVLVSADDLQTIVAASRLPQVAAALGLEGLYLQPESASCNTSSASGYFPFGVANVGTPYGAVDRPRIVAGRLPDQSNPGEIALAEQHARRLGLGVGDRLRLRAFIVTPDDVNGCAPGLVADLKIVGVLRHVSELGSGEDSISITWFTKAFRQAHPDLPYEDEPIAFVRLRNGTRDFNAFANAAEGVGAHAEPLSGFGADPVQPALDAIAVGLWAVAAVLAAAVLAAVGVGLSRQATALEPDLRVLAAFGWSRRRAALAASLPGLVPALGGTVLAGVAAVALSKWHLIGLAARTEPDPGVDIDAVVLGIGLAATLAVTIALAVWSAWRVSSESRRSEDRRAARAGMVSRLQAAGAPPWASIGAVYALGRTPTTAGRLPNRLAAGAAGAAVAGAVAVVLFGGGLHHAQVDPTVYGWGTWDAWVEGGPDSEAGGWPTDKAAAPVLSDDPAVEAIALTRVRFELKINDEALLGMEANQLRGTSGPTVVAGRLPNSDNEIALGENTADDLHVGVGDRVLAEGPGGQRRLTVVGVAGFPPFDRDPFARGFFVRRDTTAALGYPDECNSDDCFQSLAVSWRDGTDVDAALRRLERAGFDVARPEAGGEIGRLNEVDSLPLALAIAIAVVAAIGLVHTFAVTLNRRRKELAITRALGFTRRQVRQVILAQGLVLGVVSAMVGGVGGVILGRIAWAQAANAIGIPRGLPIAPLTVAGVLVAMVVLALALAFPAGFAAAHARPAIALREDE